MNVGSVVVVVANKIGELTVLRFVLLHLIANVDSGQTDGTLRCLLFKSLLHPNLLLKLEVYRMKKYDGHLLLAIDGDHLHLGDFNSNFHPFLKQID